MFATINAQSCTHADDHVAEFGSASETSATGSVSDTSTHWHVR